MWHGSEGCDIRPRTDEARNHLMSRLVSSYTIVNSCLVSSYTIVKSMDECSTFTRSSPPLPYPPYNHSPTMSSLRAHTQPATHQPQGPQQSASTLSQSHSFDQRSDVIATDDPITFDTDSSPQTQRLSLPPHFIPLQHRQARHCHSPLALFDRLPLPCLSASTA